MNLTVNVFFKAQSYYQPETAILYQSDSVLSSRDHHYYPPHHPPEHKPSFVGAVTFNMEPAHFVFNDKQGTVAAVS